MKRSVLFGAAGVLGLAAVTGAWAQQADVIKARQELMKQSGQQLGAVNRMVRGQEPYDAAKVNAAFDVWAEKAQKLVTQFPENSRTGETRALAKIWQDPAGWSAEIAKFRQDVAANRDKAVSGLEGLKAATPAIVQNCNSCHESFRRPQT